MSAPEPAPSGKLIGRSKAPNTRSDPAPSPPPLFPTEPLALLPGDGGAEDEPEPLLLLPLVPVAPSEESPLPAPAPEPVPTSTLLLDEGCCCCCRPPATAARPVAPAPPVVGGGRGALWVDFLAMVAHIPAAIPVVIGGAALPSRPAPAPPALVPGPPPRPIVGKSLSLKAS